VSTKERVVIILTTVALYAAFVIALAAVMKATAGAVALYAYAAENSVIIIYPDPPKTLEQEIAEAARAQNVEPEILIAVAKCESNLKHEGIYGDGGRAYGLMQFHEPTFEMFKAQAKMPELEYKNRSDQITLAAWAFAHGLSSHWTCAKTAI